MTKVHFLAKRLAGIFFEIMDSERLRELSASQPKPIFDEATQAAKRDALLRAAELEEVADFIAQNNVGVRIIRKGKRTRIDAITKPHEPSSY